MNLFQSLICVLLVQSMFHDWIFRVVHLYMMVEVVVFCRNSFM